MVTIALPAQKPAFLDILSIRPFRILWFSNGLTFMGIRIQDMAVAWLVLEMTGSKLWVGIVNGLPALAIILFSLMGGVLADRSDKRSLLSWSRMTLAGLMFLMAFLITTGAIGIWQLMVIVFVAAGVYGADMPISRTLIFDYVGRERLLSAISLNSIIMDVGAIAGPWVAGMLIADVGVDAALYLLGAAYLTAFAVLAFRRSSATPSNHARRQVIGDLVEGFRYLRRTPSVAWLVSLGATVPLAGVFFSMMPIYARDVLNAGAGGLGMLIAAYGVGALVASITMTMQGKINRVGRVVVWSATLYGAGMLAFGFAQDFEMAVASVFVLGVASTYWKNATGSIVQTSVAEEMRGRVMSVFGMGAQMLALGWLIGGALSTVIGNQATLVIAGGLMAAFNIYVYTRAPQMRRSDQTQEAGHTAAIGTVDGR